MTAQTSMRDRCVAQQVHVSLITLGVRDVAAERAFYERMGLVASSASNPDVAFFATGTAVLAVWGRRQLAADAKVPEAEPGAVALAWNVPAREGVDAALARAKAAGARVTKPAEDTAWGGRSGYFADPEGHLWEVAWNPHFPLDENGRVTLP